MSGSPASAPPPERMGSMLSAIAAQARRTNLIRAAELRASLEQATSHSLDDAGWQAAERTAHQLAGSAGTFGYPAASELARSLEHQLGLLATAGLTRPDPAHVDQAHRLLDQLTAQLSAEPELD